MSKPSASAAGRALALATMLQLGGFAVGCGQGPSSLALEPSPSAQTATNDAPPPASMSASAPLASALPSASAPPTDPGPSPAPTISARRAREIIRRGASSDLGCADAPDPTECLLRKRYESDDDAQTDAIELYRQFGSVAGLERAYTMDGGWRGKISIVPELPVGPHRRHLSWVLAAAHAHRAFFDDLEKASPGASPAYRHASIELLFFRSVGRTTPSAYADGWAIAYNVSGSLHRNAEAVSETMFHEIFHLNDAFHQHWSDRVLGDRFRALLDRCRASGPGSAAGLSTACLRPHAPNDTMVRGGTFYAFQPGGGPAEYGAELAIRYYREHRALLAGQKLAASPFKCGGAPNDQAYRAISVEFFGGVDLTPDCRSGPTPP